MAGNVRKRQKQTLRHHQEEAHEERQYTVTLGTLRSWFTSPEWPPYSSLLYAEPSFLGGTARVLDMGSTLFEFNVSLTPQQADYCELLADWRAIAHDAEVTQSHLDETIEKRAS